MNRVVLAVIGIIVIAAGTLVFSALFTVHQTQQALVLQLGNPIRAETEPGLKFKLPIVQPGLCTGHGEHCGQSDQRSAERNESATLHSRRHPARLRIPGGRPRRRAADLHHHESSFLGLPLRYSAEYDLHTKPQLRRV